MNHRLVPFTKHLLDFMFYIGILMTLSLPAAFRWAGRYVESFRVHYIPQTILYMLSGILCLLIIWELRRMFQTVLADDAFVDANTRSLRQMGKYSFLVALLSLIRLFFWLTPATLVIIIVFSIAGLFSLVLSQVFEKAVQYKLENDLTI